MQPKFQSSFIPQSSSAESTPRASYQRPVKRRDLFTLLSTVLFTLSILLALGAFGYKFFLENRITQMGADLEAARAALQPETIGELTDLNSRLVSTQELLKSHRIISPLFDFLELATPATVRYTDLNYNVTNKGLELALRGEARSYAALAAAAELFNRSKTLKNTVFSDLSLDTKGSVLFSLTAMVDPAFLSYEIWVERQSRGQGSTPPVATSTPSGSATSTRPNQ